MTLTSLVTEILSFFTLVGDLFIVLFLIFFLYKQITKDNLTFLKGFNKFMKEHALLFAFLIALLATSGSLFYSEIAGYDPCKLCWLQRIFMYPQVILLGVALWKKDRNVPYYSVPLSVIGAILALYHYLTQVLTYSSFCSATAESCAVKFVFHFGYVTIPMMALTAFLLIILFNLLWLKK